MSYTSKFTGKEIDNILTLAKEFSGSNAEVEIIDLTNERLTTAGIYTLDNSILNYDEIIVQADLQSEEDLPNRTTSVTIFPKFLEFPQNGGRYLLHIMDTGSSTDEWKAFACEVMFGFTSDTQIEIRRIILGTSVTDRTFGISHIYGLKLKSTSSNIGNVEVAKKQVLFEGKHLITANTSSDKNLLSDNIKNYDYITLTTGQEVPSGAYNGMIFEQNTILVDTSSIYVKDNMPATISQWVSEFDRSGDYEYLVTGNFGDGTQLVVAKCVKGSSVSERNHYITKVVGFKIANSSNPVESSTFKKQVLFDGEFTTVGTVSEANLLNDSVFNYDVVYLTTYQKSNGSKYRLNTVTIDVSTLRATTVGISLWTSSVYYANYGYYMAGNFGDGTQLCINENSLGASVTDREHGICKVVGIKY